MPQDHLNCFFSSTPISHCKGTHTVPFCVHFEKLSVWLASAADGHLPATCRVSATTRAGIPLLALGSCMYNGASSEVKMLRNLGRPHCVNQAPSFTLIAPGCCEHGACMPQICYYSYTHKHCWSQPTPASWRCRNKGQTLPMLVPPFDPKALKCALVINTRTAEKMDRVSTIGMLGP